MWSELLAKEKFSLFSLLQTGVAASRYWPHHLHVNSDGSHTDESHRIRAFSNSGVRRRMLTTVGTYSFIVKG